MQSLWLFSILSLNSYVYVLCHLIQKQNQDTQTKMATNRLENNTRDVERLIIAG